MHPIKLLCFASVLLFACPAFAFGQDTDTATPTVTSDSQEVAGGFRAELRKALRTSRAKGLITRKQQIQVRVAMLSPAFMEQAENLALIQMAFSGEDVVTTADGKIDRAIDWEGFAAFLEKFIPILLMLLEAFK